MKTLIIGDVHGMAGAHRVLMDHNPMTLQLGDCGFKYDYLLKYDPLCHKVLAGNHDNYDELNKWAHNLGDYGVWNDIFFVRGAYSVDVRYRTIGIDWWANEELNYEEGLFAIEFYQKTLPNYVVTHDCPNVIRDLLLSQDGPTEWGVVNSRTGEILDRMLEIHKPKIWIFGHWHRSKNFVHKGTRFICLNELETYTLET